MNKAKIEASEREAEERWGEVRAIFEEIAKETELGQRTTGVDDALNALDRIDALAAEARKKTLAIWSEIVREIYAEYGAKGEAR